METVVVKDVNRRDNGWIEIKLDDGRTVSTKKKPLGDQAFQSRDIPVAADITEKVNGKFTNYYLNKIVPLDEAGNDAKPAAPAGSLSNGNGNGGNDEKQKRIAAQWAVGRALELASLSEDVTFPLTDSDQAEKLFLTAQVFNTLADRVAKS